MLRHIVFQGSPRHTNSASARCSEQAAWPSHARSVTFSPLFTSSDVKRRQLTLKRGSRGEVPDYLIGGRVVVVHERNFDSSDDEAADDVVKDAWRSMAISDSARMLAR